MGRSCLWRRVVPHIACVDGGRVDFLQPVSNGVMLSLLTDCAKTVRSRTKVNLQEIKKAEGKRAIIRLDGYDEDFVAVVVIEWRSIQPQLQKPKGRKSMTG